MSLNVGTCHNYYPFIKPIVYVQLLVKLENLNIETIYGTFQ